jgi:hypothetical protein
MIMALVASMLNTWLRPTSRRKMGRIASYPDQVKKPDRRLDSSEKVGQVELLIGPAYLIGRQCETHQDIWNRQRSLHKVHNRYRPSRPKKYRIGTRIPSGTQLPLLA